jgi:hypothetical protein
MSVCCECCVMCHVEVFATGWSLVQRSPTECGVSECDREASLVRRPWPTRGCRAIAKKKSYSFTATFRRTLSRPSSVDLKKPKKNYHV